MATRKVVLTDTQSGLVDRLVASGRQHNASEALRAGRWTLDTFGPRQAKAYEEDLIARCGEIAEGPVHPADGIRHEGAYIAQAETLRLAGIFPALTVRCQHMPAMGQIVDRNAGVPAVEMSADRIAEVTHRRDPIGARGVIGDPRCARQPAQCRRTRS